MSTSRDDLPAVEEPKPPTLGGTLMALANLIFKREAVMVAAALVVLVVGIGGTVVWAQGKLDAGMEEHVAPVVVKVEQVEARVAALEKNQADMQRMTVETNATLKLVAMRLGVTPITLELPKDGGP